uniref:Uncharacterized protein n=1 Tax=Solanum tuberosum TaxID=4113 RepID=M0ZQM2_SOLTU
MTSDGNFNCTVESGISNLVWLHISFACTGFRTSSEHPVGVFNFGKKLQIFCNKCRKTSQLSQTSNPHNSLISQPIWAIQKAKL